MDTLSNQDRSYLIEFCRLHKDWQIADHIRMDNIADHVRMDIIADHIRMEDHIRMDIADHIRMDI